MSYVLVGETLTIATSEFDPCVVEHQGSFTGFDIDLLAAISKENGWECEIKKYPFAEILQVVKNGNADMGIAGISVLHAREQELDFSVPYYNSGLQLLVKKVDGINFSSIDAILHTRILNLLGCFILFLFVCGHLIWWSERGDNDGIQDKYFPGILDGLWCALATVTTVGYGDKVPRRWVGRCTAGLIMCVGIGFFGIVVAELSSITVLESTRSPIESINDIRGKTIATVQGSSSVAIIQKYGGKPVMIDFKLGTSVQLLTDNVIDAVLFDSPAVKHVASTHSDVVVLDAIYAPQYYAIALPLGSKLRKPINIAILKLKENGSYQKIHTKWFGND